MNTNDNNNYNFNNHYNLLSNNEKETIKQKVDSYRNELLSEKKGLISLALQNIRDTELANMLSHYSAGGLIFPLIKLS